MKKIGIIGGMSPTSTIDYYKIILDEYYKKYRDHYYPDIIIYSVNFGKIVDEKYNSKKLITEAINYLSNAGADFVVAACNSIHTIYHEIESESSIPWISIMDPVVKKLKEDKVKKVGLVGTLYTMNNKFFEKELEKNAIKVLIPKNNKQILLNDYIYSDIIHKKITNKSKELAYEIIDDFKIECAQGIILACTELHYLFDDIKTDMKLYDSTSLHAKFALECAEK